VNALKIDSNLIQFDEHNIKILENLGTYLALRDNEKSRQGLEDLAIVLNRNMDLLRDPTVNSSLQG